MITSRLYLLPTAFFAMMLALWWWLDHSYPLWDAGSHFQDAIKYADLLKHPHLFRGDWWQKFLTVSFNYPLTQHLIFGASKLVFGPGRFSDALVNIGYLLVLSISLAKIVRLSGAGPLAAAAAVILVNCYTWVAIYSHAQMLDFGHIALSCLGLWSICAWQANPTIKRAIAMAALVAVGATAKQAAMVFLVAPCLLLLAIAIKKKKWKLIPHLIATGVTTVIALLFWLLPNRKALQAWKDYYYPQATQHGSYLEVFWQHLTTYVTSLPYLVSPLLFALWLASLIFLKPQLNAGPRGLLFVSALTGIPLMCLMSMNNPEARYILPALLTMACESAVLTGLLWEKGSWKKVCATAVMILAVVQYLFLNFTPVTWVKDLTMTGGDIAGPPVNPLPAGDPWGQEWIFSIIDGAKSKYLPTINLFPSTRELSVHTLTIAALTADSKATLSTFRRFTLHGDVIEYTDADLNYYNWYVFKTGDQGKGLADKTSEEKYNALEKRITNDTTHFKLAGTRDLVDGSKLSVYQRVAD